MFYTYVTNQHMHAYKYAQSLLLLFHRYVLVTPVNMTIVTEVTETCWCRVIICD